MDNSCIMKNTLIALVTGFVIFGCQKTKEDPLDTLDQYATTYEVIQGTIWNQSCTSCHYAGSSFARQSNMVLTADVSYSQLINRSPDNASALEDGLVLVGDQGLESLYTSFLWEKINVLDQEHFNSDHPGYGSIMPLGGEPLTNGQLEYIRQWILAGAPEDGDLADRSVLKDTSRYTTPAFKPLEVPASGIQFHVEPFDIQANSDREIFIYKPLENEEPLYISSYEIAMKSGSHHFILYSFPEEFDLTKPMAGQIRDVYTSSGSYNYSTLFFMQYHDFIAGTQVPTLRYNYPEGVALKVPANAGFDLNSHYANRKDVPITGEVYANIHTIPEEEVVHLAQILNLNNDDFVLPAKTTTTLDKTYTFSEDRHVFQLWSHAHEHNTEFKVFVVGGERNEELIYYSNDWEHPPILQLDPPLHLEAGQGLRLEATYNNWESRDLTFGLRSTDEMMILFGYFYYD